MPANTNKLSQFWQELKRRKVIRIIIVYAAAGFAVIEFVDIVTEPLSLPEWALALVIILVAVGLPIAIIFSWIFDITAKGFKRTEAVDKSSKSTTPVQEKSIIVLPLEDISPDKDNEYFADGLTEEITADLSQINDLLVISRSSAMTFKGTNKKITEIANEVNVRYVFEGSVRKAEHKLRITAQLIDAASDTHLWARKYDGILDDVFDMQEKVSQDIVEALKLKLTADEKNKIALRPIDNFEAYDFFMRAYQEIWQFTEDALERGLKYIQHAVAIVGDNHLLYSAMALIYFHYYNLGFKQEDYVIISEKFAHKALSLNPDSSKALHVMGVIEMRFNGNPYKAVRYFKRALAIEPSLLTSLGSLIVVYCFCGKISAALPLVDRIKNVNPLTFQRYMFEGYIHYYNGNYNDALEPFRHCYEIDPENPANWIYARTLANCGKCEEAISIIDKGPGTKTKVGPVNFSQMLKHTLLAEKENLFNMITSNVHKLYETSGHHSYMLASLLTYLGEIEKALPLLENAINKGVLNYPHLVKQDPFLESIRGEEQFKQLMKKVKPLWENFEP